MGEKRGAASNDNRDSVIKRAYRFPKKKETGHKIEAEETMLSRDRVKWGFFFVFCFSLKSPLLSIGHLALPIIVGREDACCRLFKWYTRTHRLSCRKSVRNTVVLKGARAPDCRFTQNIPSAPRLMARGGFRCVSSLKTGGVKA